jgi:hypothetical protein
MAKRYRIVQKRIGDEKIVTQEELDKLRESGVAPALVGVPTAR